MPLEHQEEFQILHYYLIIPLKANDRLLGQTLHSTDLLKRPDATPKSLKSECKMRYYRYA